MTIAIKIENLSKQYRLGLVSTRTLSHDLNRWYQTTIRGKEDPYLKIGESARERRGEGARERRSDTRDESDSIPGQQSAFRIPQSAIKIPMPHAPCPMPSSDYIWALRDINLEVKQGEVLGIIGKNGAGKSTLLKILSKVTAPTTGTIRARGRIASLLEVGTGFHPEMTGRENIFMNGAILGMTKPEIRKKFDEIVDFAGVETFIDTPVKRYSSGMMVRLGFAVAAHLEPEILIVDEVLAVGDAEFQRKAIGKMQDISIGEGRTVLFVSHNMQAIKALCTNIVLLRNGNISFNGNVNDGISGYLKEFQNQEFNRIIKREIENKKTTIKIIAIIQVLQDQLLKLKIQYISLKKHSNAFIAIDILNHQGIAIMQAIPTLEKRITYCTKPKEINIEIDLPMLIPNEYFTKIWIGRHNTETYEQFNFATSFTIINSPTEGRIYPHSEDHGYVVPKSVLKF